MSTITKSIICITCPQGCVITVKGNPEEEIIDSVDGNKCSRGLTYAKDEFIHPVRILTSSARVSGLNVPLIAVRTSKPIPKELLFKGMEEIKKINITEKINTGDIIIHNFLGTEADLISSGSVE